MASVRHTEIYEQGVSTVLTILDLIGGGEEAFILESQQLVQVCPLLLAVLLLLLAPFPAHSEVKGCTCRDVRSTSGLHVGLLTIYPSPGGGLVQVSSTGCA